MQIINVNLISMNYENVYGYLCFCCADAVDCGVGGCFGLVHPLLPCQALGQALVLFHIKGEGDLWLVLSCSPASRAAPLDCGSSPQ